MLRQEIERHHRGEITFDEYARRVARDVRALAASILRRWPAPVDVEDVEQEMKVAMWRAFQTWRSDGAPIHKHVAYSGYDKAKKWVHKQRAALRREDTAPSRHALPLSALGAADDRPYEPKESAFGSPELREAIFPREKMRSRMTLIGRRAALQREHPELHIAIGVLFDCSGDVDQAASVLWSDPWCRDQLRLKSEVGARRRARAAAAIVARLEE